MSCDWHLVFNTVEEDWSTTHCIEYMNYFYGPIDLDVAYSSGSGGTILDNPSMDSLDDELHVGYRKRNVDGYITDDTSIMYMHNIPGYWTNLEEIYNEEGVTVFDPHIAIDGLGNWHIVFQKRLYDYPGEISRIDYFNNTSMPMTLMRAFVYGSGGTVLDYPTLYSDKAGKCHVSFRQREYGYYGYIIDGEAKYMKSF